jgi:uncharacterized protein YcbK (DUF882 family)
MSDFFKSSDFACPCCGQMEVALGLMDLVERMQDALGFPLKITSGFRCHRHNSSEAVKGSPQSPHLDGLAVDLACVSDVDRWDIVEAAAMCGAKGIWLYATHVHVDLKERPGGKPRLGVGLKR